MPEHGSYPRVPRLIRDDRRRISSRCVTNRNSSCTTSLDHARYKTLPARPARRPNRYKTLPARPARRPNRYKTLPASGLGRPNRYKTLPASPKTPILAHFSHAGRTIYRFRHQHDEHGEKVTHQHPTSCIMPRSAHITGTIHGLRTLSGHIPAGTSINARCRHSNDSPATRLRPTQNPHHRVREGHQRPHLSSTSESPV